MTISEQLQAARFIPASGSPITFLIPRENESGGRKVAVHEYPGSGDRFVQDLGGLLPSFSITALIHGFDVVQQRQRVTAALSAGEGILIHPYLGRRLVSPVNFELRSSDAALGEIIYSIDFIQTTKAAGLNGAAGGIQSVFDAAANARTALDEAATGKYSPVAFQKSVVRIGDRVNEGLGTFQSQLASVVNPIQDAANEVSRQILRTQGNVLSISRTPLRLFQSMRGISNAFLSLAETPSTVRDEWSRMANFGSPQRFLPNGQLSSIVGSIRSAISRTTRTREIEDDNLRIFDQHFRIEALINSFEAEADNDFETDIELQQTLERLTQDYDRLVRNQSDVVQTSNLGDEVLTDANVTLPSDTVSEAKAFADGLAFDPTLLSTLEDLKASAFEVLLSADKAPFKVTETDFGLTDIQQAAYALDGDLERLETLSSLNSSQNLAAMRAPVKGLA